MRRNSGMTLIELMMVIAIVAIVVAIALPSYQRYQVRGIRSQGQQFLMDLAQAQEQYFLDQRQYATGLSAVQAPGLLIRAIPPEISAQYTLTLNVTNPAGAPSTFQLVLTPNAGSTPASQNDGALILNNLQQRWRENDGNLTYNAHVGATGDCTWESSSCVPN